MKSEKLAVRSLKFARRDGVALVVTLLMLSVITFMTIAFLAVSRRERASVSGSLDQVNAQAMADAALARAQADIAAYLMANNPPPTNQGRPADLLNYDMMMSHNFINPNGYDPKAQVNGYVNVTNVSYNYSDGTPLNTDDQIQNIANLLYDPRLPVYVTTNTSSTNYDFRYWVDYNRNGRFESNGFIAVTDELGKTNGEVQLNYGEPEWIGVLRQPDTPLGSNNNMAIGRFAYIALPIGKTLDLNFIHNYAKNTAGPSRTTMPPGVSRDKFLRNQGHGPWEINMAGYLYGLNPVVWDTNYNYTLSTFPNQGNAFDDAYAFLRYRYNNDSANLLTWPRNFPNNVNFVGGDYIDEFSDGPIVTNAFDTPAYYVDDDNDNKPWPGSTNYNNFYEPQDIFDKLQNTAFVSRMTNALAQNDTTNRYTFSRMLATIGTDSDPELYCWVHDNDREDIFFPGSGGMLKRAKVNINFANLNEIRTFDKDPVHARLTTPTVLTNWDALAFFTNTADLLLRSQEFEVKVTNGAGVTSQFIHFGVTNIPIYSSTNGSVRYNESIHRLLQLAANLYDANGNVTNSPYDALPSVFRPQFEERILGNVTNVYITNFTQVIEASFTNNVFKSLSQLGTTNSVQINRDDNVWGVPLVVGAKRGLPNFNEYSLSTALTVTRKLKFRRESPQAKPTKGFQMYQFGISNVFGMELWNSYRKGFTNGVDIWITNAVDTAFLNEQGQNGTNYGAYSHYRLNTNFSVGVWAGNTNGVYQGLPPKTNTFVVISNYVVTLPTSQYEEGQKHTFDPNISNYQFQDNIGFPTHDWRLMNTNYMFCIVIDHRTRRIIDVVNLGDFYSQTNIYPVLVANSAIDVSVWNTNGSTTLTGSSAPNGVIRQIKIVTENQSPIPPDYKPQPGTAAKFTQFMNGTSDASDTALEMDCPYQPNQILVFRHSYMANDPLVHYTLDSLRENTDKQSDRLFPFQNVDLGYNLGKLNTRYSPWGAQNDVANPVVNLQTNMVFKDPMITASDDWFFPTNKFANVGWIGRVHRGTPWQTVYLKSDGPDYNTQSSQWVKHWATSITSYPTNDWRLLDLFTVAPNENAARGLLSVNQTNLAPWSAVLSGLYIITNDNFGVVLDPTNVPPIVAALNDYRLKQDNQVFHHVGDILGVPQLTRTLLMPPANNGVMNLIPSEEAPPNTGASHWDEVVERIPQNIFSLLKVGDPRFVIYSFGQSLKPANNSLVLGGQYRGMCTNYQITGEVVTRSVCRLSDDSTPNNPKIIVESFNILPGN